jgi:voltage-gated potassium channel
MKSLELFWLIMKRTYADKFLYGFLIYFFISCFLIQLFDPKISSFGDALWFGLNVVTSIGLGDYTVVSVPARIVTAFLGLYAALIFSFIPGLISSYYMEKVKLNQNESIEQFLDQLEHLPDLSKEELADLSEKVKNHQKKKIIPRK